MMNRSFFSFLSLLCFLFFSSQSLGAIDVYEFDDEATREEFVELTKELRCPKCQNQDIADSNAPIAKDMRTEVHRLLGEGKDKAEIISFMIERFGEFVTYKPKKSAETYMLWYGPWFLIVFGVIFIFSLSRLNKKASDKTKSSHDEVTSLLSKYDNKNK